MPTRTVFGWQKPCYLLGEGYAKTFTELMEDTEWDKYGVGKYEKCADCMVHCGFEGTAATRRDQASAQDAADPDARASRPKAPMAPDIDLSKQRPAEFTFSRHRRAQDVTRSGPAIPAPQRSRQRSNSRKGLVRAASVRISAGTCRGFLQQRRPARGPDAMPPSGFIATGRPAAAHGARHRKSPAAATPSGRLRRAREAGGDLRFHIHRRGRRYAVMQPDLVSALSP